MLKIQELRTAKNLTQRALAEQIGVKNIQLQIGSKTVRS